ncbi:hypothetical protein MTR67_026707 [Solanum verrucosum]|uniref:Uncharacterized protein n=1 Tax=Solanum verrucosum TaxID=315347 RepID=A0AAF0TU76_SOLVR|nr:hypothetical protein MTR67_026707 [Solanum verrucosum]
MIRAGAMTLKEHKMLEVFLRLSPSRFLRVVDEDPLDFLTIYCEQLHTLVLMELRGTDFNVYHFVGPTRQWWRTFIETRLDESLPNTWTKFFELYCDAQGAATRELDMMVAVIDPILTPEIHMIGIDDGLSLIGEFRR